MFTLTRIGLCHRTGIASLTTAAAPNWSTSADGNTVLLSPCRPLFKALCYQQHPQCVLYVDWLFDVLESTGLDRSDWLFDVLESTGLDRSDCIHHDSVTIFLFKRRKWFSWVATCINTSTASYLSSTAVESGRAPYLAEKRKQVLWIITKLHL